MKTQRIRNKTKKYLKEHGPKSTIEILEHINNSCKHGTTVQQLGNILAKDPDIIKVGCVKRGASFSGTYSVSQWAIKRSD